MSVGVYIVQSISSRLFTLFEIQDVSSPPPCRNCFWKDQGENTSLSHDMHFDPPVRFSNFPPQVPEFMQQCSVQTKQAAAAVVSSSTHCKSSQVP